MAANCAAGQRSAPALQYEEAASSGGGRGRLAARTGGDQTAKLDRDGVLISYDIAGDGPAVLLTHGYASSARMWAGQVAALSDRYRLITWDMRGHADSDSPDDPASYSEAATVADMAAVLDVCGVQRAVIGGLSLGGTCRWASTWRTPSAHVR